MLVEIFADYEALSDRAYEIVATLIRRKPNCVLGFATGSTPLGLYRRLVEGYQRGELDFSKVTTFNLDEYVGLPPSHPQSYHHFMWEHLFKHINVHPGNVYIPDGMAADIEAHCRW